MRDKRKFLNDGYVHLITRGNGKQVLFEDDQDRNYYLKILRKYASETGIVVCAYCLMENHVHLLVHYQNDNVSLFMQKLGIAFTRYYNEKYDHSGHLFQGRYKAEYVNDQTYFLVVNRYILQNPLKAGICSVEAYPWSSFDIYDRKNDFVDSSLFLELIGGYDAYVKYVCAPTQEKCMEYETEKISDTSAYRRIFEMLDINSGSELLQYDKIKRDEALKMLKEEGMTIRQISRLTGIGRNIVQKA